VRMASKSRWGHCPTSGLCARLRTIESCKHNGESRQRYLCAQGRILKKRSQLRSPETQIAREDAMPHERSS
jgi:hypothetical protein